MSLVVFLKLVTFEFLFLRLTEKIKIVCFDEGILASYFDEARSTLLLESPAGVLLEEETSL